MPTPSSRAPSQFTPFSGEEDHLRAHRALDTALIGLDGTSAATTNSVTALIATTVGLGGAIPGTSSTAATITGFYRTAGVVAVGIPAMVSTSAITTVVSVGAQVGNNVQPGVPVIASPQAALPDAIGLGQAYCTATNSITFSFFSVSGNTATTSVNFHIFSIDTIP